MLDQQQDIKQRRIPGRHHEHMLWAARGLSLVPCVLVALLVIRNLITLSSVSAQEPPYYMYLPPLAVIPGIIAWWWHRIGGTLLILMSAAIIGLVVYGVIAYHVSWGMDVAIALWIIGPFVGGTATGGILHIVYWYKEKRPKLNRA